MKEPNRHESVNTGARAVVGLWFLFIAEASTLGLLLGPGVQMLTQALSLLFSGFGLLSVVFLFDGRDEEP